jgi:L-asparaginase
MRRLAMTSPRLASLRAPVLVLLPAVAAIAQVASPDPPRVHLLGTGGTIAGGQTGALKADDLASLIPALSQVATVTTEDFVNIGSSRMTPEIQFGLARRLNELFASDRALAGIVVTHGTDSLEETAFFIDLLVRDPRPVVFAAAQRPPREPDSDGPRNLMNAVRIAASPGAQGLGVLVTLNDEIHAARDVRKTHAVALDAFQSPGAGPVGHVDDGRPYWVRKPARRLTLSPEAIEPRVELLTLVAGSDGRLVRATVEGGAQALVIEVFGRGNVPPVVMEHVKWARERGAVVVFTSRTRGGRIELSEEARALGVVGGEDLDGLKARMLLIAALGVTRAPDELQGYFSELAGGAR